MRIIGLGLMAGIIVGCAVNGVHDVDIEGVSSPALVEANDTVLVQSIDGKSQDMVFIGQQHSYRVRPGKRIWVVEYGDMFFPKPDTHDKVTSAPARIVFDAKPGRHYRITHDPVETLEAARAFSESPQFRVEALPSGAPVPFELAHEVAGLFVPANAASSVEAAPSQDAPPAANPVSTGPSTIERLQQQWQNASEAEKRQFLESLK